MAFQTMELDDAVTVIRQADPALGQHLDSIQKEVFELIQQAAEKGEETTPEGGGHQ